MHTRFICLANSLKEGGRCMAGIELNKDNIPIFIEGRPHWIRPVCTTLHGEIPNDIASPFKVLNIIEFDTNESHPHGYQSENMSFNELSLHVIGNYNRNDLGAVCDDRDSIFGNRGKAVSHESIIYLNHSLVLVSATKFKVTQKTYQDQPNKTQKRMLFSFHGTQYDLPITSPLFLALHNTNPDVLNGIKQIYMSLSLGMEWKDWYYKLVAGVIM